MILILLTRKILCKEILPPLPSEMHNADLRFSITIPLDLPEPPEAAISSELRDVRRAGCQNRPPDKVHPSLNFMNHDLLLLRNHENGQDIEINSTGKYPIYKQKLHGKTPREQKLST